jgi:fatty acid desaturase
MASSESARGVAWVLGAAMTLAALPNAGALSLARLPVAKPHSAGLTRANIVSLPPRRAATHAALSMALSPAVSSTPQGISDVSRWHRERRRAILAAHPEVAQMERSDWRGLLLLLACNAVLYACMAVAPSLHWLGVVALALTVGATASLWQLTMLHEVVHGTMVKSGGSLQAFLLWACSFPSVFGYFLYLRFGHLSHHNRLGAHSMAELFSSHSDGFEDGDILFVTHRMQIAGPKGPMPPPALADKLPDAPINVAFNFFSGMWRPNQPYRNMVVYCVSMFLERLVLIISDKVVAITGYNAFFPNKPPSFHRTAANHARLATLFQAAVVYSLGWKALVLLYIAETAWSLPVHPGCAMFITNHGSSTQPRPHEASSSVPAGLGKGAVQGGGCQPTRSTYAGFWYDAICCNTNYHLEHHDFPNIPILLLPRYVVPVGLFFSLVGPFLGLF